MSSLIFKTYFGLTMSDVYKLMISIGASKKKKNSSVLNNNSNFPAVQNQIFF